MATKYVDKFEEENGDYAYVTEKGNYSYETNPGGLTFIETGPAGAESGAGFYVPLSIPTPLAEGDEILIVFELLEGTPVPESSLPVVYRFGHIWANTGAGIPSFPNNETFGLFYVSYDTQSEKWTIRAASVTGEVHNTLDIELGVEYTLRLLIGEGQGPLGRGRTFIKGGEYSDFTLISDLSRSAGYWAGNYTPYLELNDGFGGQIIIKHYVHYGLDGPDEGDDWPPIPDRRALNDLLRDKYEAYPGITAGQPFVMLHRQYWQLRSGVGNDPQISVNFYKHTTLDNESIPEGHLQWRERALFIQESAATEEMSWEDAARIWALTP